MQVIQTTDYVHKRQPWAHQETAFLESRDKAAWALFMEQGTGKSKVLLDTAVWNYTQGRIDGVLLICDKGITRTWVEEHLPENIPDHVPWTCHAHDAQRAATKKAAQARDEAVAVEDTLSIVITNWQVALTATGRTFLERFLNLRRVLMILDESDAIKTPKARTTKALTTLGRRATMRRIATGTPVADGPFDVFSQLRFLDPHIFGMTSFRAFKNEFGDWDRFGPYPVLLNYKRLDELHDIVTTHGHRVLKQDCFDLPDKVYERIFTPLTSDQNRLLKELRDDMTYFGEPVENALVALTRATQISAGFYADPKHGHVLYAEQPKADAIVQQILRLGQDRQVIVWGQYHAEMVLLARAFMDANISFVQYDGSIERDARDDAERLFRDGRVQVMLATTAAASKGRNWQNASFVFYHSNSPKLIQRLQSEDRAHRGTTTHKVTYIDLCAEGSGDAKRLAALRAKKNIADMITGDNVREWI